ncbi:hypothetical protein BGZ97_007485 [Linnemannia gamsii]|uniref:Uncharacterized protein n=1 Tax=Linnemannia gamsii TaxID=64522 RepID=A0A9P6QQL3_9FUNG|nr:hypothetical protein BGZ97_007485 [Linnemannia gamsii]
MPGLMVWLLALSSRNLSVISSHWIVQPSQTQCGHRAAISIKSLDAIRSRLQMVKETKPKDYQARTIYREALPGPMVSECKSWRTDYYLTEIRNVIKSKDDIERLWLGKDIQKLGSSNKGKGKDNAGERRDMEGVVVTSQKAIVDASNQSQVCEHSPNPASLRSTTQAVEASGSAFLNLAVKAKAVYQPTFRFKRWQVTEKNATPECEEESIYSIESRLLPL